MQYTQFCHIVTLIGTVKVPGKQYGAFNDRAVMQIYTILPYSDIDWQL